MDQATSKAEVSGGKREGLHSRPTGAVGAGDHEDAFHRWKFGVFLVRIRWWFHGHECWDFCFALDKGIDVILRLVCGGFCLCYTNSIATVFEVVSQKIGIALLKLGLLAILHHDKTPR